MPITNMEPRPLWKQFDEIRKIPHPSGHEEKIRQYFLDFAKDRGFEVLTDDTGNVVVKIPATPGHENAPTIVLQGHMDMVCEKNNDVEFDFFNDPIQLKVDGEWLSAKGTTLGADNGVGLAAALGLADDESAVHGPLEVLATVDEETGLTGAAQLDASMIQGKTLLNLDTEEIGAVYIGCAGGGDSTITLPVGWQDVPDGTETIEVKVSGLRGGHSGVDVHEQRGNAIKALARLLWKAGRAKTLTVSRFEGGGVHNAIPREAGADCVVAAADVDAVRKAIESEAEAIRVELASIDPGFKVAISATGRPDQMLDGKSNGALLNLILSIRHGVDAMSFEVPGLVETSNNLASVWMRDGNIVIGTSSRSSSATALQSVRDSIRAAAELAGATVEEGDSYPGWKPNLESKILETTKQVHERVFGFVPEMKAIHAGLECGIIGEKLPGMDMVSFGPQIEWPHSPEERINIPSVEKFYTLLKEVLKEIA
jgi:dipeptidase D